MRTKRMIIWVMVMIVCLVNSKVRAVVDFRDGQTYNIDYSIEDDVRVDYEAPGMQTTVNLLDGGAITSITFDHKLYACEDSIINISGG